MRTDAMTDEDIKSILAHNIASVRRRMAAACRRVGRPDDDVTLVAVTKYVANRIAQWLVNEGVHDLGESRPQELWRKADTVRGNVFWHLIGHLQRNKIDRTLPLTTLIHSVDSERLLIALNEWGRNNQRIVNVLIEANVSGESAKTGMIVTDVAALAKLMRSLEHVRLRGLMTMAALQDAEACRPTFRRLRQLKVELETQLATILDDLSMGMTNDFEVAIEEGATIVRLGSCLFEGLVEDDLKA